MRTRPSSGIFGMGQLFRTVDALGGFTTGPLRTTDFATFFGVGGLVETTTRFARQYVEAMTPLTRGHVIVTDPPFHAGTSLESLVWSRVASLVDMGGLIEATTRLSFDRASIRTFDMAGFGRSLIDVEPGLRSVLREAQQRLDFDDDGEDRSVAAGRRTVAWTATEQVALVGAAWVVVSVLYYLVVAGMRDEDSVDFVGRLVYDFKPMFDSMVGALSFVLLTQRR